MTKANDDGAKRILRGEFQGLTLRLSSDGTRLTLDLLGLKSGDIRDLDITANHHLEGRVSLNILPDEDRKKQREANASVSFEGLRIGDVVPSGPHKDCFIFALKETGAAKMLEPDVEVFLQQPVPFATANAHLLQTQLMHKDCSVRFWSEEDAADILLNVYEAGEEKFEASGLIVTQPYFGVSTREETESLGELNAIVRHANSDYSHGQSKQHFRAHTRLVHEVKCLKL